MSIITFIKQCLYKNVHKCKYIEILTQTHGAWKSHLHKDVNIRPPEAICRILEAVDGEYILLISRALCCFE